MTVGPIEEIPVVKDPVDVSKEGIDTVIEVTPVAEGEAIAWADLDPLDAKTQGALEQIEPVVAVAVIDLNDGRQVQHTIYELKGKFWVGNLTPLDGSSPCADTIDDAKAVLAQFYTPDYTEAWREHMRSEPPPGWSPVVKGSSAPKQ